MWPLKRRGRAPEVGGDIGYHGLTSWWLSAFTPHERAHIEQVYRPMGAAQDRSLVKGKIGWSSATPASFLNGLSSWFRKPADRHLERRILEQAEQIAAAGSFDLHLTYSALIENVYRDRETDAEALGAAITYCLKQIAMAPQAAKAWRRETPDGSLPSHAGYTQLAIIREKERNFVDAIRLAEQAKRQGWAGDWDKRIDRCRRKLGTRT